MALQRRRRANTWLGHRGAFGSLLVAGLAAIAVGATIGSGLLTALGVVLSLVQGADSAVNLVGRPAPGARSTFGGIDRRELARRMLATRRAEEVMPSIPGGAIVELGFVAENDLVTFRSQVAGVVQFDELLDTIRGLGGPLVLVGAPGAGKSLTARRVVMALLEEACAGGDTLAERFLLSRWDGAPMGDWLSREWSSRGDYGLDPPEAARLLSDPSVVVVLDGLDEIPGTQRQSCVDAINALIDVRPELRLVICCRDREYRALAHRIDCRRAQWVAPLAAGTVAAFIADHGPASWEPVQAALAHDQSLCGLLSTPLMLVAAMRAFRDDPTPLLVGSLPERQHVLWDGYIDRMLQSGSSTDGSLLEQRRCLEDVAITMAAGGTQQLEHVPHRLREFMDRCVDRHLLRRSAGTYQCLHRQLLGHLIGRATFDDPGALRSRLLTPVASEARAWNNLANEALAAGHSGVAVELSRRALDLAPDDPRLLAELAFHLLAAMQLEEAVKVACTAEVAAPRDWRPASTLAYALFALGEVEASAAARERAAAKGHRMSDGSFLAFVLTLWGLHDEAYALVDSPHASDSENLTQMDRAIALLTLGKSGEANDALAALDVNEVNLAVLSFLVPVAAVSPLIPDDAFELIEPEPGAARLVVFASDHYRNLWGEYYQVVFAVSVRPKGRDDMRPGGFMIHRFVNQRYAYELGRRLRAFPTTMASIEARYTARDVVFDLRVDEHETLVLRVPRAQAPSRHRRVEATTYTMIGGVPHITTNFIDASRGAVADPATVGLEVGTGPVAGMLRSLGLPRTPRSCTWGEGLTLTHPLPRPLRDAIPESERVMRVDPK